MYTFLKQMPQAVSGPTTVRYFILFYFSNNPAVNKLLAHIVTDSGDSTVPYTFNFNGQEHRAALYLFFP